MEHYIRPIPECSYLGNRLEKLREYQANRSYDPNALSGEEYLLDYTLDYLREVTEILEGQREKFLKYKQGYLNTLPEVDMVRSILSHSPDPIPQEGMP
ncbi:hypothetical protein Q5H92_14720 [Hymenobacter sp. M29]|uniref:Uncharacterized protein n=1 Tax=Hymenobacter mellowenesis TaxID=3063995 RepID=A0ABT9ACN4_9BACT|nr:hypothetical protein [Hymenobacter sp. M29]MDO7847619.1 hypothetical protein [Hymenobacter sp. M29]